MQGVFRIALWTILLCAGLQARVLPLDETNIQYMEIFVKCPSNSTFYAPKNVKVQCITTALDCVAKELDVKVKQECDDPREDVDNAVDVLFILKDEWKEIHPLTNSTECACEKWPQTPFKEFLQEMESLIQLQNAMA